MENGVPKTFLFPEQMRKALFDRQLQVTEPALCRMPSGGAIAQQTGGTARTLHSVKRQDVQTT